MSATGGDRDSLLLIITVEDDVRCCLSMFRNKLQLDQDQSRLCCRFLM